AWLNKKSCSFEVIDNQDIAGGSYTQYDDYDMLEDIPLISSPLSASIVQPMTMRDNRTGIIKPLETRGVVEIGDQMRWKPNTMARKWALRQWLHARKGKQKPFWYPHWRKDFRLM